MRVPMQGQLEHVAQGCVQLSLQNNFPMGGPHNHSEQPLPVPDYPHNNFFFFCSKLFPFVQVAPSPVTEHH